MCDYNTGFTEFEHNVKQVKKVKPYQESTDCIISQEILIFSYLVFIKETILLLAIIFLKRHK